MTMDRDDELAEIDTTPEQLRRYLDEGEPAVLVDAALRYGRVPKNEPGRNYWLNADASVLTVPMTSKTDSEGSPEITPSRPVDIPAPVTQPA